MIDKKTEALKLAEDALKRVRTQDMELVQLSMIALAAIREALASEAIEKPAPPPECQTEAEKTAYAFGWFKALESVRKRPAEQKPKKDLMYSTVAMQERHAAFVDRAVATLEQAKREALAEQPTQQEPVAMLFGSLPVYDKPAQQEPVAWLRKSDLVELRACNYMRLGADSPSIWAPNAPDEPSPDMELVAVYTSPPAQRTWVGLTEEEILELNFDGEYCIITDDDEEILEFARSIEATLKSKNT